MTDSWTEGEDGRTIDVGPVTVGEPEDIPAGEPRIRFHPEADAARVQADIERREKLRADEVQHLTELRDRVQQGIDDGAIDLESGAALLLNISKVRMALAGVGYYPGAF